MGKISLKHYLQTYHYHKDSEVKTLSYWTHKLGDKSYYLCL